MKQFREIRLVLVYTMILNLLVMAFKLIVGYSTGSLSLIADGFDSFFDSASNVVGLVGIYLAARPPDPSHPYGHRKFETLAAAAISGLLFVTTIELAQSAIERFRNPIVPEINVWTFAAILFSVGMHLYVSIYERRRGEELKSDVLVADAMHTRADVLVSISVLVGMIVVRLGVPIVDPILALIIAVMIAKIGVDIIRENAGVLLDAAVVDRDLVARIVSSVPGVLGFHQVRSRGQEDDIHLDVHVHVQEGTPVEQAHHIAHQVQRRLRADIGGLQDVIVHIEPMEGSGDGADDLGSHIRQIASRIPHATVHSIQAHEVEGLMHVMLHLEVARSLSVQSAHDVASQLEDMLRTEIADLGGVEVHIEPADHDESALAGDDDSYERARHALEAAVQEIGGLYNCHKLTVFREESHLLINVHCECDPKLSVEEAHALTMQLEQQMHENLPVHSEIIIHVEPHQLADAMPQQS